MMDTDKERTLTGPFTEITSVKGQQIKHKAYSWVKTQQMKDAVGRVRMSEAAICQVLFSRGRGKDAVSLSVQTSALVVDNSVSLGENQFFGMLASRRHKSKTRCRRFAIA